MKSTIIHRFHDHPWPHVPEISICTRQCHRLWFVIAGMVKHSRTTGEWKIGVDTRNVGRFSQFNGIDSAWKDWSVVFRSHAALVHPALKDEMPKLEALSTDIELATHVFVEFREIPDVGFLLTRTCGCLACTGSSVGEFTRCVEPMARTQWQKWNDGQEWKAPWEQSPVESQGAAPSQLMVEPEAAMGGLWLTAVAESEQRCETILQQKT